VYNKRVGQWLKNASFYNESEKAIILYSGAEFTKAYSIRHGAEKHLKNMR
jgi:hypothetical protein